MLGKFSFWVLQNSPFQSTFSYCNRFDYTQNLCQINIKEKSESFDARDFMMQA